MRSFLTLLAITLMVTAGCSSTRDLSEKALREKQIIPADIPAGTVFQPLDEVDDFVVTAELRLMRHPDKRQVGLAAVQILIGSKADEVRRNVQAAAWLPEGVLRYDPGLMGTNLDLWRHDLKPKGPGFGLLLYFEYPNYEQSGDVARAFDGPTRLRILWDGGSRHIKFPASHWNIVYVSEKP